MSSSLGLTNFQGIEKSETRASSSNRQTNADQSLINQDPEVDSQVKTANVNKNPNAEESNNTNNTNLPTTTSVFNPKASTHFNYRGSTDSNQYEPNKLVPNQHEISIENLIDYLQGTAMEMRFIDFAYLKKLGVYANNRMIVARRFAGPVEDDLFKTTIHPISTVVSWVDPSEDFFKMSFNEVWESHTDSIQKIFQEILEKDFKVNLDPGIPLPGWSTGIQFEILKALGVTNADSSNLPEGNPNLIMETSRRKVPGENGGSGLKSDIEVVMKVEYEIKYIPGIDPSFAFNDIISNLVSMGTSNSEFYLTGGIGSDIQFIIDELRKGNYVEVVKKVIDAMIGAVKTVISKVEKLFTGPKDTNSGDNKDSAPSASLVTKVISASLDAIKEIGSDVINGIISKYREKIYASISAMTGTPNAPWHITIGNPRKPFFVSGDMLCEKVSLDFGKELGYNDLPTEITATLTFRPARDWGGQEITKKFNSGKGRSYGKPSADYIKDNNSSSSGTGTINTENVKNSQNAQNKSANNSTNNTSDGSLNVKTENF